MNQKVVRRVFQHLGYANIPIANHGQEALDIIEKNGIPDLILMDVQMYFSSFFFFSFFIFSFFFSFPFFSFLPKYLVGLYSMEFKQQRLSEVSMLLFGRTLLV